MRDRRASRVGGVIAMVALGGAARVGRADDAAAVAQVVRDHVAAIATTHVDDAEAGKTLVGSPLIVDGKGQVVASESDAAVFVQTGTDVDVAYKLDPLTVVDVGRGAAWFHGVLKETITWKHGNQTHPVVRVSGIAVDDHGWKLAAVMYAVALPDKTLLASAAAAAAPTAPTITGDDVVGAQAARWFPGGLGKEGEGSAVVSGTAPAEYASGKAVGAIVKGWDKLGMVATAVDARVFAGGAIGFVRAVVAMPIKKGKAKGKQVAMVLGAVVVPDAGWKWASLAFASPAVDPYDPMGE